MFFSLQIRGCGAGSGQAGTVHAGASCSSILHSRWARYDSRGVLSRTATFISLVNNNTDDILCKHGHPPGLAEIRSEMVPGPAYNLHFGLHSTNGVGTEMRTVACSRSTVLYVHTVQFPS